MTAATFDEADFRSALGCFATGVTLITTRGATHPYGMTANAFSSVSLQPPLVLVCVVGNTEGCRSIQAAECFAVNVLGETQERLSRFFASRERPRGHRMFEDIAHHTVATGSPVLEGVAAFFDCRLTAAHEAGDHVVFIGEVVALGADAQVQPLLFHHGRYKHLGPALSDSQGERDSPTA